MEENNSGQTEKKIATTECKMNESAKSKRFDVFIVNEDGCMDSFKREIGIQEEGEHDLCEKKCKEAECTCECKNDCKCINLQRAQETNDMPGSEESSCVTVTTSEAMPVPDDDEAEEFKSFSEFYTYNEAKENDKMDTESSLFRKPQSGDKMDDTNENEADPPKLKAQKLEKSVSMPHENSTGGTKPCHNKYVKADLTVKSIHPEETAEEKGMKLCIVSTAEKQLSWSESLIDLSRIIKSHLRNSEVKGEKHQPDDKRVNNLDRLDTLLNDLKLLASNCRCGEEDVCMIHLDANSSLTCKLKEMNEKQENSGTYVKEKKTPDGKEKPPNDTEVANADVVCMVKLNSPCQPVKSIWENDTRRLHLDENNKKSSPISDTNNLKEKKAELRNETDAKVSYCPKLVDKDEPNENTPTDGQTSNLTNVKGKIVSTIEYALSKWFEGKKAICQIRNSMSPCVELSTKQSCQDGVDASDKGLNKIKSKERLINKRDARNVEALVGSFCHRLDNDTSLETLDSGDKKTGTKKCEGSSRNSTPIRENDLIYFDNTDQKRSNKGKEEYINICKEVSMKHKCPLDSESCRECCSMSESHVSDRTNRKSGKEESSTSKQTSSDSQRGDTKPISNSLNNAESKVSKYSNTEEVGADSMKQSDVTSQKLAVDTNLRSSAQLEHNSGINEKTEQNLQSTVERDSPPGDDKETPKAHPSTETNTTLDTESELIVVQAAKDRDKNSPERRNTEAIESNEMSQSTEVHCLHCCDQKVDCPPNQVTSPKKPFCSLCHGNIPITAKISLSDSSSTIDNIFTDDSLPNGQKSKENCLCKQSDCPCNKLALYKSVPIDEEFIGNVSIDSVGICKAVPDCKFVRPVIENSQKVVESKQSQDKKNEAGRSKSKTGILDKDDIKKEKNCANSDNVSLDDALVHDFVLGKQDSAEDFLGLNLRMSISEASGRPDNTEVGVPGESETLILSRKSQNEANIEDSTSICMSNKELSTLTNPDANKQEMSSAVSKFSEDKSNSTDHKLSTNVYSKAGILASKMNESRSKLSKFGFYSGEHGSFDSYRDQMSAVSEESSSSENKESRTKYDLSDLRIDFDEPSSKSDAGIKSFHLVTPRSNKGSVMKHPLTSMDRFSKVDYSSSQTNEELIVIRVAETNGVDRGSKNKLGREDRPHDNRRSSELGKESNAQKSSNIMSEENLLPVKEVVKLAENNDLNSLRNQKPTEQSANPDQILEEIRRSTITFIENSDISEAHIHTIDGERIVTPRNSRVGKLVSYFEAFGRLG